VPDAGKFDRRVEPTLVQQIQVDPWTDVVAVPYRQKKLAELQTSIKQLHSTQTSAPQAVPAGKLGTPTEKHVEPLKAVDQASFFAMR
jgi:hypothetical protein